MGFVRVCVLGYKVMHYSIWSVLTFPSQTSQSSVLIPRQSISFDWSIPCWNVSWAARKVAFPWAQIILLVFSERCRSCFTASVFCNVCTLSKGCRQRFGCDQCTGHVPLVLSVIEAKSKDFQCSLTAKRNFELHWDESKGMKGPVPRWFVAESLSFCYNSSLQRGERRKKPKPFFAPSKIKEVR